jgi:hypothetical protein
MRVLMTLLPHFGHFNSSIVIIIVSENNVVYSYCKYLRVIVCLCYCVFMKNNTGFVDKVLGSFKDTGCEFSKRCQDCTFKDCILSLPYKKKQMILKADTILSVIESHNKGLDCYAINRKFKLPVTTIKHWVYKKDSILNSLNQYVIL